MMRHEPGSVSEWGFSFLVKCYPSSIRDAFGPDLQITFRDAFRDRVRGPGSFLGFWARTLWEGAGQAAGAARGTGDPAAHPAGAVSLCRKSSAPYGLSSGGPSSPVW